MKVYIAGKITGKKNYKATFDKVEKRLLKKGHKVHNPSKLGEGFPWDSYMPICYAMIDACDAIYLLHDWEDSKGAKLEYEYALKKGMMVMYQLEDFVEVD